MARIELSRTSREDIDARKAEINDFEDESSKKVFTVGELQQILNAGLIKSTDRIYLIVDGDKEREAILDTITCEVDLVTNVNKIKLYLNRVW